MSQTSIRLLTAEDLDFALGLSQVAGWNQTRRDWQRMLELQPEGCFLLCSDGAPAATATTTVYADDTAWIGMVLVDPRYRRRGYATQLMEHCIDYLRGRNVGCIKLDATPAGQAVYEKLGFQAETVLHRWEADRPALPEAAEQAVAEREEPDAIEVKYLLAGGEWQRTVLQIDPAAFGGERLGLLQRLARDSERAAFVPNRGFGMLRRGALAWYLGPLVAGDESAGWAMIRQLLTPEIFSGSGKKKAGQTRCFWDVPETNLAAVTAAHQFGFIQGRPLIRMRLGERAGQSPQPLVWAISGPETG